MSTTPTNPHPEFSHAWIEWEDQYFRDMIASGEMADLMRAVAHADHLEHDQQPGEAH